MPVSEEPHEAVARLVSELDDPRLRVCVLGGTSIQRPETEQLAAAIAEGLKPLEQRVLVFTEGMPGVQHAFAKKFGDQSCHLVPNGHACSWPGRELHAGSSVAERREIFALLGDVYLVLEGGPNVASQVKRAFQRGACIIPLMRTGGASAGLFSFPARALRPPPYAQEHWPLLKDESAEVPASARAAVSVVEAVLSHCPEGCGRDLAPSDESPESSKPLLSRAERGVEAAAAAGDGPTRAAEARLPSASEIGAIRDMLGIGKGPGLTLPVPSKQAVPQPLPLVPGPRLPLVPAARGAVSIKRQTARDEWNKQEILVHWAVARNPGRQVRQRHELPEPLMDAAEFREYFSLAFPALEIQLWECEDDTAEHSAGRQLQLGFRSADRDGDGFCTVPELLYGLQCVHGQHCLTRDAVRLLASTSVTTRRDQLLEVMQSLNDGLSVSISEAQAVLHEAALVAGASSHANDANASLDAFRRAELLWALGAWYARVQREHTSWKDILVAAVRRWIPSDEEHHGCMLHHLARTTMDLPKTLPLPKRLGGQPLRLRDSETSASRASQACVLMLAVVIHIFFLAMLLLPSVFFSIIIYLGSEHGDDRCPRDLDALLVWFGALGLSVLVIDCANDGSLGISVMAAVLKGVLALTPLLGMAMSHGLDAEDAELCGQMVFWSSKCLWSFLSSCEMTLLCLLAWSFHVARNHERQLRRLALDLDGASKSRRTDVSQLLQIRAPFRTAPPELSRVNAPRTCRGENKKVGRASAGTCRWPKLRWPELWRAQLRGVIPSLTGQTFVRGWLAGRPAAGPEFGVSNAQVWQVGSWTISCCCNCCRKQPTPPAPARVVSVQVEGQPMSVDYLVRSKEKGTVYALWLMLGLFGGHHFYLDRLLHGCVAVVTLNFLGLGWLVDLFWLPYYTRSCNSRVPAEVAVKDGSCSRLCCCMPMVGLVVVGGFLFVIFGMPTALHNTGVIDLERKLAGTAGNPYVILDIDKYASSDEVWKAYTLQSREVESSKECKVGASKSESKVCRMKKKDLKKAAEFITGASSEATQASRAKRKKKKRSSGDDDHDEFDIWFERRREEWSALVDEVRESSTRWFSSEKAGDEL
ncbi:unnamed protein product [Effrenium voratum]|nr:unnamed protein product [Effrenium voratum]